MPTEQTCTTIELAKEEGLTGKSIRLAIHRGDLFATRIRKGSGRTASATEFVIQRSDADDWKARRAARKVGIPYPVVIAEQSQRRALNHHAYFDAKEGDSYKDKVERWKRDALSGIEQAKESLRGIGLKAWWRAGVGTVVCAMLFLLVPPAISAEPPPQLTMSPPITFIPKFTVGDQFIHKIVPKVGECMVLKVVEVTEQGVSGKWMAVTCPPLIRKEKP